MQCGECGKGLTPGAAVCPVCGTEVFDQDPDEEDGRVVILQLRVTVPKDGPSDEEVADTISAALDESPRSWGEWIVGGVEVKQ